jgi:virulence-associated protein VapD
VNIKSEKIRHQAGTESNNNSTANDGIKTQQQRLDVQDLQESSLKHVHFGSAHEDNARQEFRVRFLWIEVCVENIVAQSFEGEARRRKSREVRVRFGRESF